MKKSLVLSAAAALLAVQAFASGYWVVMKDGTRYQAKAKPTINGNRATIQMQSGSSLIVDASQIDVAKSEEVTRLGGGTLIGTEIAHAPAPRQQPSSLGSQIKLRPQGQQQPTAPTVAAPAPITGPTLGGEVIEKFERAYENVGVFEHKITSTGPHVLRAEMTIDNEDKVFNAISATAFLMIKNAGLTNVTIDEVDMFMKMTNGGTAGRFQMMRSDADALYAGGNAPNRTKLQDYFVRKVLF
jgi:hypothetical protein